MNDDQELKDPLSTVSKHTRNTINHTRNEIDWLLKDETISAIRACESIDGNTLEEVRIIFDIQHYIGLCVAADVSCLFVL